MMNDLPMDLGPADITKLLRDPNGVAKLLVETNPQTGDSPAMLVADVINVIRADTKMLAQQQGVEIEINMMTPDRAAELLAGVVGGDGADLLVVFNELSEQRDKILRETMDEDAYEQFLEQKHEIMHTEPADLGE